MKGTKWILYAVFLFLCISPRIVFAVSNLETEEITEELDAQQKTLPFAAEKKVTWMGGYIQIPVDLGGYSADELSLGLSMKDGDRYFGAGAELDGNTAKFPIFQGFDSYGVYAYQVFTKAGTYDGELKFFVSENNYRKELCTETVTVVVPKDSAIWKLSRQMVKFDGSRDIVFSFENGTNGYALHSVSKVGLFVDKSVGNLFLSQGFQCNMNTGKLTIHRDAAKKALLDFAKKQQAGVRALPDKIYVNAFAVTKGGEELRFNIIDTDDFLGSKDVAWSLDLTGFKSAQVSQQKVEQKINITKRLKNQSDRS